MARLLRVAVVALLCFVLLVPGAAVAQENGTETPTAGTPANGTGNGTGTENASSGGSVGYSPVGMPGMPSPWEMTLDIITSAYEDMRGGVASWVDKFNEITMTLPAPGEPDDPSSWVSPPGEDTWWNAVWIIYWALAGLLILPLFVFMVFSATRNDPVKRREGIREGGKAFFLIFAGWLLIPLWLHLMNALALTFAPAGDAFFATPEDATRLGLGVLLGVVLAITKVGIIIVGLLVLLIQWVMVYLLVALFPAFIVAQAAPSPHLRSIGKVGIAALVFLGVLKFVQAVTLRFLFELPMTLDAPGATLLTFATTLVGVLIAFVAFPYWGTKKAVPHSIVTGSSGAKRAGERIDQRRPSRHDIKERITRSNSGDTGRGSSGSAPRTSKRNGGSGSGSRSRSGSTTNSGGGRSGRAGRLRDARRSSSSSNGSGSARDLRDRRNRRQSNRSTTKSDE